MILPIYFNAKNFVSDILCKSLLVLYPTWTFNRDLPEHRQGRRGGWQGSFKNAPSHYSLLPWECSAWDPWKLKKKTTFLCRSLPLLTLFLDCSVQFLSRVSRGGRAHLTVFAWYILIYAERSCIHFLTAVITSQPWSLLLPPLLPSVMCFFMLTSFFPGEGGLL